MRWILWQQIIKWVLKKLRTKLKAYDLILQRSTKKWRKKSGVGVDDVYGSPWFAYKSLTFILDSITPTETKETGAVQRKEKQKLNDYWRTSADRLRHASMTCAKRHALDEGSVETWTRMSADIAIDYIAPAAIWDNSSLRKITKKA